MNLSQLSVQALDYQGSMAVGTLFEAKLTSS